MKFYLGYLPEPPDERDLLLTLPLYDLPAKIDWTEQLTGVKNQMYEGACIGFATTAMSEFKEWKQHGIKFDFSERWIYEWAKRLDEFPGENYEGTTIRAAMKALQKHGICFEKDWPYTPNQKGQPSEKAAENAYLYRIKSYRNLGGVRNIDKIKRGLHETGPIVAGFQVHKSWFEVGSDGIIKSQFGKSYGGHAVLVVGYDDKFLKIRNSWGRNWGRGGYGYLEIDYAMEILHSCWAAYDL